MPTSATSAAFRGRQFLKQAGRQLAREPLPSIVRSLGVGALLSASALTGLSAWLMHFGTTASSCTALLAAITVGTVVGRLLAAHRSADLPLCLAATAAAWLLCEPTNALLVEWLSHVASANPAFTPWGQAIAALAVCGPLAAALSAVHVCLRQMAQTPVGRFHSRTMVAGGWVVLATNGAGYIALPGATATWIGAICLVLFSLWLQSRPSETRHSGATAADAATPLHGRLAWLSAFDCVLIGAMAAHGLLLVRQLMPLSPTSLWSLAAGLTAGAAGARWLCRPSWPVTRPYGLCLVCGWLLAATLGFPTLVWLVLSLNSTDFGPTLGLSLRYSLLAGLALPIGLGTSFANSQRSLVSPLLAFWGLLAGWSLIVVNSGSAVALSIAAGGLILRAVIGFAMIRRGSVQNASGAEPFSGESRWAPRFVALAAVPGILLLLLAVQGRPVATRPGMTDRLLFSTEAFVGYRSKWDQRLLASLSDSRSLGSTWRWGGPVTAVSRGGGLVQLRQCGIPLAQWSNMPSTFAQPAAEVVEAVWPLLLCESPERVLIADNASGTVSRVASAFPVREIDLLVDDGSTFELAERFGAETLLRPWRDDPRCRTIAAPLELLAAPSDAPYDVIILPTPQPLQAGMGARCHVQFYQRAASRLSTQGVACVRLESIDWGLPTWSRVCGAFQQAFPACVLMEVSAGEMLLLGAHDPAVLRRDDLPQRLELPHVSQVLRHSGWDWSLLLNLPAYDHAALAEVLREAQTAPAVASSGSLGRATARDTIRWGDKGQEIHTLLSAQRTSLPLYQEVVEQEAPALSRKSRYLEWMGPDFQPADVLRRLGELASQLRVVADYPETYQWEYRKLLRQELKDRPRTSISPVAGLIDSEEEWHAEDRLRKAYIERLGEAAQQSPLTQEAIEPLYPFLQLHDPLLGVFAYREVAELMHRAVDTDPAVEAAFRLHAISYAPPPDTGVRYLASTMQLIASTPDAVPDAGQRYDALNFLLQTLRSRWERKGAHHGKAAPVTLNDVDQCILAVERSLACLDDTAPAAGVSADEWSARREALERLLLRPLRGYRAQLFDHKRRSQATTKALLERAAQPDSPLSLAPTDGATTPLDPGAHAAQ